MGVDWGRVSVNWGRVGQDWGRVGVCGGRVGEDLVGGLVVADDALGGDGVAVALLDRDHASLAHGHHQG